MGGGGCSSRGMAARLVLGADQAGRGEVYWYDTEHSTGGGANGLWALRTPITHLGRAEGANHLSHLWTTYFHPAYFHLAFFPYFTFHLFTFFIFNQPIFVS